MIIKLILTRGSGGRGIDIPSNLIPNLYIMHYPYSNNKQHIRATISEVTLPVNRHLAGTKHLNRLPYILAAQRLSDRPEFNEALLRNERGHVVESIVHNLFFRVNDEICTPDVDECGVLGILRQRILKKLDQQGKTVNIANFKKSDLLAANECFLCNSVQGVRPITRIDDRHFDIGPLTREMQQAFNSNTDD